MKTDFDCVVIGGGPAGGACAHGLVRAGLSTAVFERARLPRHKACSGVLLDRVADRVRERFGEIPARVLTQPASLTGWAWYFPHAPRLVLRGKPAVSVSRAAFDAWLLERSGARILDGHTYLGHAERDGGVECRVESEGRERLVRSKYLIGADGGRSRVLSCLSPSYHQQQTWVSAYQHYLEAEVDLEPDYFHIFFNSSLGAFNPCVSTKDGQLLVHSAAFAGTRPGPREYWRRLVGFLEKHHGLRILRPVRTEAAVFSLAAPAGRFFLGRGRTLLAGEAAGFLHCFAEGLSCAMNSGVLAAQAIGAHAADGSRPLCDLYRERAAWEMRHVMDTWCPLFNLTGLNREEMSLNVPFLLRQLRPGHLHAIRDMYRFFRPFYTSSRGPQSLLRTLLRLTTRRWPMTDFGGQQQDPVLPAQPSNTHSWEATHAAAQP